APATPTASAITSTATAADFFMRAMVSTRMCAHIPQRGGAVLHRRFTVTTVSARVREQCSVARWTLGLVVALALASASGAAASDRIAINATNVSLAVSADGSTAVVTYDQSGHTRHALVWGALNALPPSPKVPQVRFKFDWTGGWGTHRN